MNKRAFDTKPFAFETEAALCAAFLRQLPDEWIVYPETAGWDILLVHRVGGWQVGIEAKQSLNTKVLCQAIEGLRHGSPGPDFRAVLVGRVVAETEILARAMGITVIVPRPASNWRWAKAAAYSFEQSGPPLITFAPDLPKAEMPDHGGYRSWFNSPDWHDQAPPARHKLPEYVPEVAAGVPAPMVLSHWKITAMKVCVWVERNGSITRAVFRDLRIDPGRWMNGHWLKAGDERGQWVAGSGFPADQWRREHPTIYPKVEADFDTWSKDIKP